MEKNDKRKIGTNVNIPTRAFSQRGFSARGGAPSLAPEAGGYRADSHEATPLLWGTWSKVTSQNGRKPKKFCSLHSRFIFNYHC